MDTVMIEEIAETIAVRKRNKQTVFVCGNGGSAATAEHFTNDLFSKGVRAICLNSNTSIITMLANDFGYEHIFDKQLDVLADGGDLLIVFSCSGTSPNIVNAIQFGLKTIPIFGDKDNKTYAEIEDRHLKIAHMISEAL